MQIINTKLSIPPLRTRLVQRTRLIQKLNQGIECGFVLVSAPAGYGKSTLLSFWLSQWHSPFTWLSLDEGDNHPARFLTYLICALRKIDTSVGEDLETLLHTSLLPDVETLLTPLVNELANVERSFCLVLDDYQLIQNQFVHQAIGFLLEHRPSSLHLVISTRADPPLPLARLRARSQLVELRMADLRFTSPEISEFLCNRMGLNLSEADLALLVASTEGWIAGVQIAGISLQGREDVSSFILSFNGENRYIMDYLFDEVFQRQSQDIQNFLLQTSILNRLCAPLCHAVSEQDNCQAILETLERNNLFLISLDEQRKWFRYHHLFIDLLQNRLKVASPASIASLHQRASIWYAAESDLEDAITHALAARDFERAACLIDQISQNLDILNQQDLLISWEDQLPREILETHPWLCLQRAWGNYSGFQRGKEEEWLQAAEKSAERLFEVGHSERRRIQGSIMMMRAHKASIVGDISRVLELSNKALELFPDSDDLWGGMGIVLGCTYWALGDIVQSEQAFRKTQAAALKISDTRAVPATCYIGLQQVKQGRLHDALVTFHDGLRLATLPDGKETLIAGFPNVKLGDVLREQNEMALASQHLFKGVEQCIRLGQVDLLVHAYVCLGRYQLANGDLEGTFETLQKADQVTQKTEVDRPISCWLEELRLRAWLAEGNLDATLRWVQSCGLSLEGPLSYKHDLHHQNLARVLVAQGVWTGSTNSNEKVSSLLDRLQIAAEKAGWVHETIKILVMQAVNNQACGLSERSLQNLALAVSLAEPGCYIRVFMDEGEILSGILAKLVNCLKNDENAALQTFGINIRDSRPARLKKYVFRLLSAFDDLRWRGGPIPFVPNEQSRKSPIIQPALSQSTVESLSGRELEVLKLLAQGCADKQIAEILVISRGTVHKHLGNIYEKLNVHSRTEAIARGRQLHLL